MGLIEIDWKFLETMGSPAMRYSLPAIAIDEEELERIQTRILPTIVQKLGMSSKLPTAIRHGPVAMGGLGLMDIRTECGIEMIKYFRHQVYRKTKVGELLIIQLKVLQIEAGIPQSLLEEPQLSIPYLTPTWILSLRQFLSNHNVTISVTDGLRLEKEGRYDEFIMNQSRLSHYSVSQQRDINLVRLYLQCTTLADLRDPHDERSISRLALGGERPLGFVCKPGWPRQETPSPSQTRLWRRYMSSHFLRYGTLWKRVPNDSLRESRKERIDMESRNRGQETEGNLHSQIADLPRFQRRLLNHVTQCEDDEVVLQASRAKGPLTIASDGGFKDTRGTFGWSISTPDNTTLFEGAGPVDGPRDVANSTRCEIAGYAAPLLILTLLTRQWGIRFGCPIRWVCDSKSALVNVARHSSSPSSSRLQPSNADILTQIRTFQDELGTRVQQKWVKGHQSGQSSKSKDVIRNNRADELATWYRDHLPQGQSTERTDHVPESRVSVSINGIRQVGEIEACLRFHINGYHLRQYLQSRHQWSDEVWDTLDLKVLGQFCRTLTPSNQVAQTKLMYDQRHTGVMRYRAVATVKVRSLLLCPCCLQAEETSDHVVQCKANPGREQALKSFGKSMDSITVPEVVRLIKRSLLQWLNTEVPDNDLRKFEMIPQNQSSLALYQQQQIGWSAAMRGFFSVAWQELASQTENESASSNSAKGLQVMRKVLLSVHKLSTQLWKDRNRHLPDLAEITQLHAQSHMVNAGDRHFCERPLDELLQAGHSVRRRWITYMRNARARFEKDGAHQTKISDFFRQR